MSSISFKHVSNTHSLGLVSETMRLYHFISLLFWPDKCLLSVKADRTLPARCMLGTLPRHSSLPAPDTGAFGSDVRATRWMLLSRVGYEYKWSTFLSHRCTGNILYFAGMGGNVIMPVAHYLTDL